MNKSKEPSPARDRIITVARSHFFAHGFRGVTMDDLAREVGMSKKTFYVHFPTKADLVEKILVTKFDEVEADLARLEVEHAKDPVGGLIYILPRWQLHVAEVQPSFVRDVHMESPRLFELLSNRRRNLALRFFGRSLVEGQKTGLVRGDIKASLVVEILLAAAVGLSNQQKTTELGVPPHQLFATLITVLIEGMLTGKGRKTWRRLDLLDDPPRSPKAAL